MARVSKLAIYRLTYSGELDSTRVGHLIRIRATSVINYFNLDPSTRPGESQ